MSVALIADANGAQSYTSPYLVQPGHDSSESPTTAWAFASIIIGFEITLSTTIGSTPLLRILNDKDLSNHNQFWLGFAANGQLEILQYQGDIFTSIINFGSSNDVLYPNTRYWVVVKLTAFGAGSTVEVYINGMLSASGACDTGNGSTVMTHFEIAAPFGGHLGVIYADPTQVFLDCGFLEFVPDEDVALEWASKSGGANWSEIDEATSDGDGSYNEAQGPYTDEIGVALPVSLPVFTSILGVQVVTHAKQTISAGQAKLQMDLRSGGSLGGGTVGRNLSTSYAELRETFGVDPNTSASWASFEDIAAASFLYSRN